jgi:hypothetical protein
MKSHNGGLKKCSNVFSVRLHFVGQDIAPRSLSSMVILPAFPAFSDFDFLVPLHNSPLRSAIE